MPARYECIARKTGGQKGWRLPSLHELNSLVDPFKQTSVALPTGHPFTMPAMYPNYWTATVNSDPTDAPGGTDDQIWAVSFEAPYSGPFSDHSTGSSTRSGVFVAARMWNGIEARAT